MHDYYYFYYYYCLFQFKEDAFIVVDIGDVLKKHKKWLEELPRVKPYFGRSRKV